MGCTGGRGITGPWHGICYGKNEVLLDKNGGYHGVKGCYMPPLWGEGECQERDMPPLWGGTTISSRWKPKTHVPPVPYFPYPLCISRSRFGYVSPLWGSMAGSRGVQGLNPGRRCLPKPASPKGISSRANKRSNTIHPLRPMRTLNEPKEFRENIRGHNRRMQTSWSLA